MKKLNQLTMAALMGLAIMMPIAQPSMADDFSGTMATSILLPVLIPMELSENFSTTETLEFSMAAASLATIAVPVLSLVILAEMPFEGGDPLNRTYVAQLPDTGEEVTLAVPHDHPFNTAIIVGDRLELRGGVNMLTLSKDGALVGVLPRTNQEAMLLHETLE